MERQGRHDCRHAKRQYWKDLENQQSHDIHVFGVDDRRYYDTTILPDQAQPETPADQPWISVAYRPFSACLLTIEQRADFHVQGYSQFVYNSNSRVACAALQIADIGSVQASFMRKFLLRPAFGLAQSAHV